MIGQTDWYTCGPAALATLFSYYYGQSVSEKEFTALSVRDMEKRGKNPLEGITLLSLRNVAQTKGVKAEGYQLNFEQLKGVLEEGLPLLVNVVQPQPHFSVVVGMVGDTVLLADPSWGLKTQPMRQFLDSWNGVTLVPQPDSAQSVRAKKQVRETLQKFQQRAQRLRSRA